MEQAASEKNPDMVLPRRRYCVSLAYGVAEWRMAFEMLHGELFDGVEVTAETCEDKDFPAVLAAARQRVVNVVNLSTLTLSRGIADHKRKSVDEFLSRTINFIGMAAAQGSTTFSIDFGFDLAFKDDRLMVPRVQLLKLFASMLWRHNVVICLPVRAPGTGEPGAYAERMRGVLRESMCGGFRIGLSVYPHQMRRTDNPADILKWYQFDLEVVRIVYEPEVGNHLTGPLMRHWLDPLDAMGFSGPVVICPMTSDFSIFEREATKIADASN